MRDASTRERREVAWWVPLAFSATLAVLVAFAAWTASRLVDQLDAVAVELKTIERGQAVTTTQLQYLTTRIEDHERRLPR